LVTIGNLIPNQVFYQEEAGPEPIILPIIVPKTPELKVVKLPIIPKEKPKSNLWLYLLVPVALYALFR